MDLSKYIFRKAVLGVKTTRNILKTPATNRIVCFQVHLGTDKPRFPEFNARVRLWQTYVITFPYNGSSGTID